MNESRWGYFLLNLFVYIFLCVVTPGDHLNEHLSGTSKVKRNSDTDMQHSHAQKKEKFATYSGKKSPSSHRKKGVDASKRGNSHIYASTATNQKDGSSGGSSHHYVKQKRRHSLKMSREISCVVTGFKKLSVPKEIQQMIDQISPTSPTSNSVAIPPSVTTTSFAGATHTRTPSHSPVSRRRQSHGDSINSDENTTKTKNSSQHDDDSPHEPKSKTKTPHISIQTTFQESSSSSSHGQSLYTPTHFKPNSKKKKPSSAPSTPTSHSNRKLSASTKPT